MCMCDLCALFDGEDMEDDAEPPDVTTLLGMG